MRRNVKCTQKGIPHLVGAVSISGLQAVSTGQLGMDGMLWKNIFVSKMYMNIIRELRKTIATGLVTFVRGYGELRLRLYLLDGGVNSYAPFIPCSQDKK